MTLSVPDWTLEAIRTASKTLATRSSAATPTNRPNLAEPWPEPHNATLQRGAPPALATAYIDCLDFQGTTAVGLLSDALTRYLAGQDDPPQDLALALEALAIPHQRLTDTGRTEPALQPETSQTLQRILAKANVAIATVPFDLDTTRLTLRAHRNHLNSDHAGATMHEVLSAAIAASLSAAAIEHCQSKFGSELLFTPDHPYLDLAFRFLDALEHQSELLHLYAGPDTMPVHHYRRWIDHHQQAMQTRQTLSSRYNRNLDTASTPAMAAAAIDLRTIDITPYRPAVGFAPTSTPDHIPYVAYQHQGIRHIQSIGEPYPVSVPAGQAAMHLLYFIDQIGSHTEPDELPDDHQVTQALAIAACRYQLAIASCHSITPAGITKFLHEAHRHHVPTQNTLDALRNVLNLGTAAATLLIKDAGPTPSITAEQTAHVIDAAHAASIDPNVINQINLILTNRPQTAAYRPAADRPPDTDARLGLEAAAAHAGFNAATATRLARHMIRT